MMDWWTVCSYAGWGMIVWTILHGNLAAVQRADRWLLDRAMCMAGVHEWLEIVKYREYLDIHPLVNMNGLVRMYITRRWMMCKRCMRVKRT